ncbi:MAG: hypothetical protein Kow0047_30100 [Anaerolineae bacterium]
MVDVLSSPLRFAVALVTGSRSGTTTPKHTFAPSGGGVRRETGRRQWSMHIYYSLPWRFSVGALTVLLVTTGPYRGARSRAIIRPPVAASDQDAAYHQTLHRDGVKG